LNRIRQRLQTDIDNRAAEIVASENKVKANKAKIDEGSDARIAELENLERRSKEFDKKLTDFDAEISRLEQLGGKHTPTYKKLLEKRAKDGKITFTDENGKPF
jgi:Skp family chaperone for outer membrane proteins